MKILFLAISSIFISYCVKGQDSTYINLMHNDSAQVDSYYDSDLKDTMFVPKIDFTNSKYRKEGVITKIYKNNILITLIKTQSDSTFTYYFYPTGQLRAISISNNKEDKEYYFNGQLRKLPLYAWLYKEYYYPNGQLWLKLPVNTDGIYPYKEYWSNGNLKEEANYYAGMFFGNYKKYYQNGQIEMEGQYRKTPKDLTNYNYKATTKEGTWYYYDENGKLNRIVKYKDDIEIK